MNWANQISAKIIKTVKAEYTRDMKKQYVLNEMKDVSTHPKFDDLRIKIRHKACHVKFYGTIEKLDYEDTNFGVLAKQLKLNHSTREPKLVEALNIFSERNMKYLTRDLLIQKFNPGDLPFKLSTFSSMQKSHNQKTLQSLHIQWRTHISNEISECLRTLPNYNPAIPNRDEYLEAKRIPMRRFLKRVDLIFRQSVKSLTEHNIGIWVDTCRKFVMEHNEDLSKEAWRTSERPLIQIEIKSKERNQDRKKRESDSELIYFEPSEETIMKRFKEPLNWLIQGTNSFETLEPDIVNMVNLEQKVSFPVDEKMPMFAKAFEEVEYYVNEGLKRPLEILAKFQKYAFLLHKPADEVVKSYWGKDKENKKSVDDLDDYLQKVSESINEIQGLCINEMNCHFFQIKTKALKETLVKRAKDIMKAVMQKINSQSSKAIKEIQLKYDNLKVKMTTEPQTEEQLKETQ